MDDKSRILQKNVVFLDLEKHIGTLNLGAIILISGLHVGDPEPEHVTSLVFSLSAFFLSLILTVFSCFIISNNVESSFLDWGHISLFSLLITSCVSLTLFFAGVIYLMGYIYGSLGVSFFGT